MNTEPTSLFTGIQNFCMLTYRLVFAATVLLTRLERIHRRAMIRLNKLLSPHTDTENGPSQAEEPYQNALDPTIHMR